MASDDSSSDGEDAEEELDAASMSFFMRLQNNIRDYEAHIGLLDALRNAGLPNALASARERFLEEFPLTEKMWNTWIDDVCSSAQSDGDIRLVETLFRRAQGDCMSPQLWLQHVDFVLARASESSREGDKVEVRALLEEAVTYVGVHVLDGAAMWARYLSFERAQLEETRKQEGADVAVTIAAQFDRLVDIYCRQVSLPLRDNDASMSEARAWLAHEQPPPGSKFESAEAAMQALDLQHEKGAAALKVREPHENAIAHASFALDKAVAALATTAAATAAAATMATAEPGSATRDEVNNNNSSTEQAQTLSQGQQEAHARATHGHSLAETRVDSTWLAYVNFELETEGTDRAVALLERAVAAHPQRPALWLRGARLLRQHNRPAAHAWVARAVRSCWWSSKLWLEIMRSTELKAQSNPVDDVLAEVKSLADRALELGQATAEDYLQILLSVSICARRQAVQKLKDAGSCDAEALSYAYGVARKQISEVSKWASGFLSHSYPDWAVAALQLARQHAFAGQALLTELARSCCAAGQPGALILSEALSDGRALWEDVVTKHSTSLQPWLEYSRFEQTVDMLVLPLHKDGLEGGRCAEVFRRAVKHISDFPQAASEAWLQYAQQAGSLYDCEEAELHYEAIAQVQQANSQYGLHHKNLAKRNGNKHHRGMKRQRAAANSGDNKHESRVVKRPHKAKPRPATQQSDTTIKARPSSWTTHATTIFVTSLPDCATEADLHRIFGAYGTIQKLCMMYDRRNHFKGNAFVQFDSADTSLKALKQLGVEGGVEQCLSDEGMIFTPTVAAARMSAVEASQQQATAQAARKQKRLSKSHLTRRQTDGTQKKHTDSHADAKIKPRTTTSLFSMRPRVIVHKASSMNK